MGRVSETIDARCRQFIEAQRLFFTASAPSGPEGRVNLSPKGMVGLSVIDERTVAYLDLVGSGVETIAHLRENGRITLMFCAFEGPPLIVRLYGRGETVEPGDERFAALRGRFPAADGARAIIVIKVDRVSESCGHGVPLYSHQGERPQMDAFAKNKGAEGLRQYQREKNRASIDGLPGLRWVEK